MDTKELWHEMSETPCKYEDEDGVIRLVVYDGAEIACDCSYTTENCPDEEWRNSWWLHYLEDDEDTRWAYADEILPKYKEN